MSCHLRSRQAYSIQVRRQEGPVRQKYTLHDSSCSPMHMPLPTTIFELFILYTYTQSLSNTHLLIANDVNVNLCPHGISIIG